MGKATFTQYGNDIDLIVDLDVEKLSDLFQSRHELHDCHFQFKLENA